MKEIEMTEHPPIRMPTCMYVHFIVRLSFMYFLFCISKYTKCAKYIFQTLVSILFDRVSLQLSSYCIIMHHIQYQVYIYIKAQF